MLEESPGGRRSSRRRARVDTTGGSWHVSGTRNRGRVEKLGRDHVQSAPTTGSLACMIADEMNTLPDDMATRDAMRWIQA